MSLDMMDPRSQGADLAARSRLASALEKSGGLVLILWRILIGIALCFHYIGAVFVVGWTLRLMRRRIYRGLWWRSPLRTEWTFEEFADSVPGGVSVRSLPPWLAVDSIRESLDRPQSDGSPPGKFRRIARLPGALIGGLGTNLRLGFFTLICTYVLTLPTCSLWLAAWFGGWEISFNKAYESSAVGISTFSLGILLFILAMTYIPIAWAHLAATGDPRAFFQFALVRRIGREKLGALTLYALGFSLLTLPLSVLRLLPLSFTEMNPAWEAATPEQIGQIMRQYIFLSGIYVFLAFVVLHLWVASIYRAGLLGLLNRDRSAVSQLPSGLSLALEKLGLLPEEPSRRRRPVLSAVVGTGRSGKNMLLRMATALLWFSVVAQVAVSQFVNFQPVSGWLNLPLIHFPTLHFLPPGAV